MILIEHFVFIISFSFILAIANRSSVKKNTPNFFFVQKTTNQNFQYQNVQNYKLKLNFNMYKYVLNLIITKLFFSFDCVRIFHQRNSYIFYVNKK